VAHLLAHDPIRELPIYRDGFHAGRDVGLAIAVAAITAERAPTRCDSPGTRTRLTHAGLRDSVLLAVAKVMARRFRK
jgi:hypothetical protein